MNRAIWYLEVTVAFIAAHANAQSQEIPLGTSTLLQCTLDEPSFSSRNAQIGEPVVCQRYKGTSSC
jgi:hypothetical protein